MAMNAKEDNSNNIQNTIQWGIIGCGNVTEVKSGPAFNKVPNSSLVAVMRRDEALVKDYAQRHQVPKWFTDAHALINDPDVNAIYIATPPRFHEEYAIAAMQAGKPVYVEKPMALDLEACLRMQSVCQKTAAKLVVAHYRRALPMFLKVKQLLSETAIGSIRTVRISMMQPDKSDKITQTANNWRVDPAMAGAGLFYDLAPHQLDLLVYFFGKALKANGMAVNQAGLYKAEDLVVGVAELANKILFSGTWCFSVSEEMAQDSFEIYGSAGKISFPVFGHELIIETNTGNETISFQPPAHIQQPMIEKIVAYFLSNGENPCSAEDAIHSMELMEQFVYGNPKTK
jgi:predicted dehydrogenase